MKGSFRRILLISAMVSAIIAALCVWTAIGGNFDPSQQKHVTAHSSSFVATFVAILPCPGCKVGRELALHVVNKSTGAVQQIQVPSGLQQVDSMRFVSPKLLTIVGKFDGALDEVTMVDVSSGKLVDDLMCYGPSISPSGRYIVYVKFFPEHGQPPYIHSNVYLVYDAMKTPTENRPNLSGANEPYVVGVPIYPLENVTRRTYLSLVPSTSSTVHSRESEIAWLSPTKLQFRDEYDGNVDSVSIDLRAGLGTSLIFVKKTAKAI